jgi:peptide/nickel transport system substrate-binding protein
MTMLLDRESIREELYFGLARITTGSFFVDGPEYNNNIEPWPFDPENAEQLLNDAGWVDSDNDGMRDRDGVPLSFELLITKDSKIAPKVATLLQEELKRAGVEMTIRKLEWSTFLESVKTQRFDACTLGWSLVPDPDPYQVWHSSQTVVNGDNSVGFVNEEADTIMDTARPEFDRGKRIEMYRRFHEILHEEQPVTFLFCPKELVAVDKRFENVKVYPYGLDPLEWTIAEQPDGL